MTDSQRRRMALTSKYSLSHKMNTLKCKKCIGYASTSHSISGTCHSVLGALWEGLLPVLHELLKSFQTQGFVCHLQSRTVLTTMGCLWQLLFIYFLSLIVSLFLLNNMLFTLWYYISWVYYLSVLNMGVDVSKYPVDRKGCIGM